MTRINSTYLGFKTLLSSPADTKLIILIRFTRFFAFGGSTIIFASYLASLGLSSSSIGLFFSLALFGDIFSFLLTLFADSLGRRKILALGSLLIVGSGLVLSFSQSFAWLVICGIFGIVSPNGREIGPFSAIEESVISQMISPEDRSDVLAWYTVIGSLGSSAGKLATGWIVSYMQSAQLGWTAEESYRAIFLAYAALGGVSFSVVCCLGKRVELGGERKKMIRHEGEERDDEEDEPLLIVDDEVDNPPIHMEKKKPFFPRISKESRPTLLKLCLLFAVDSLASGLVPTSWVTYFFKTHYQLTSATLGTLFFIAGILSSLSSLVAAPLSRRIGLIPTMVFTHLPSAIFLSFIPIFPSRGLSVFFLLARSSLASMDIAPKAAFISMVVLPEERTGVMGLVNVVRTGSQSLGPWVMGALGQGHRFWVGFVLAGALKSGYDLGLLGLFWSHKANRENRDRVGREARDAGLVPGRPGAASTNGGGEDAEGARARGRGASEL